MASRACCPTSVTRPSSAPFPGERSSWVSAISRPCNVPCSQRPVPGPGSALRCMTTWVFLNSPTRLHWLAWTTCCVGKGRGQAGRRRVCGSQARRSPRHPPCPGRSARPFCGAATELILAGKRARENRNAVTLLGTDLSERALDAGLVALQKSGVSADVFLEDALGFQERPFDVVLTNPPFGMRTLRGGARDLLDEFLGTIKRRLSQNARVVLLSHAPNSTIQWAAAGRLRLVRSFPVRLGGMNCELQHFE